MSEFVPDPEIVKAILEAIAKVKHAEKSGDGEATEGRRLRSFRFATIDDVLEAAHEALDAVGLTVMPIEIGADIETLDGNDWVRYSFQFMLLHKSGKVWVSPNERRVVHVRLSDGHTEGKAQSFALKVYLRGLLRIRTGESDLESSIAGTLEDDPPVNRPVGRHQASNTLGTNGPRNRITYPFEFGDGIVQLTADEVEAEFNLSVRDQSKEARTAWRVANRIGLDQLNNSARARWLRISKALE